MSSSKRVGEAHRVNTDKTLRFSFDGKNYIGYEGDTLASALLANGVKRLGRSFKVHRPRGLMTAGYEEPNALLQLETGAYTEPSVRAPTVALYDGLVAGGQNAWPNVNHDALGALNVVGSMFPASFYYKCMIYPSWHTYEKVVRKVAGLGKAPLEHDEQQYHKRYLHTDVLIVGAGPAGLAAALVAGRSGQRVTLIDMQEEFGGSLLGENRLIDGKPAMDWVASAITELSSMPEVKLLPRTTVTGYYEHNFLVASERVSNHIGPKAGKGSTRERLWKMRAKEVIVAAGALERPLIFANNDRPGIMLAGAVQTYLNRYGVSAGKRTVIFTTNDNAYRTAFDLHDAGQTVEAIVDTRATVNGEFQIAAGDRGITVYHGYSIEKVHGSRALKAVTIARHNDGVLGESGPTLRCDVLAMSGGWTPTIHLFSQANGSLDFCEQRSCFVPRPNSCVEKVQLAGAANGEFSLKGALEEGYQTGAVAVGSVAPMAEVSDDKVEQPMKAYWYTKNAPKNKQWLDFQYDVKVSDVDIATQENFISVEHFKRYSTNGMSVDQGKTSNVNALAVMAELTGRQIPQVGTTKFRPPFQPVSIGTYAGRDIGDHFAPRQHTPVHDFHVDHGGKMMDYGWMRPMYYPQAGETVEQTISREVLQVRHHVGLFDSSPLGKIEVKGPDAAEFLNRMYSNTMKTLKVGKARYGLMMNEDATIIDDGICVHMSENHFLVHTTSGGAARIGLWFESWLAEWPHLQVRVANATTAWASITLSGPKARDVVSAIESTIDFSDEAFPHMDYREGMFAGLRARILRASFTGERSFEINVPARYGQSLMEAIYEAGKPFNLQPYGVETLNVLRTEKGHFLPGLDTSGETSAVDVGWGVPLSKKKDDFVGNRSLKRVRNLEKGRQHFVSIRTKNPKDILVVGGHIVGSPNPDIPVETQGWVTSGCMSPTLKASVGMALINDGYDRVGEDVYVFSEGKTVQAVITSHAHYDPKGENING